MIVWGVKRQENKEKNEWINKLMNEGARKELTCLGEKLPINGKMRKKFLNFRQRLPLLNLYFH